MTWRDDLAIVITRDLSTLRAQVLAYPDDDAVWSLPAGLPNSGGTLVLHLCGNLRYFVGSVLGGTGYVRDRDAEFSTRGISRAELAALVDTTQAEVAAALQQTREGQIDADSITIGPVTLPAHRGLLHLAVHLTYHLGQIDYHRRLVTGNPQGVGALSLPPLSA